MQVYEQSETFRRSIDTGADILAVPADRPAAQIGSRHTPETYQALASFIAQRSGWENSSLGHFSTITLKSAFAWYHSDQPEVIKQLTELSSKEKIKLDTSALGLTELLQQARNSR